LRRRRFSLENQAMLDRLRAKTFKALTSRTGNKLPGVKLVKKAALYVNDTVGQPLADEQELERRAAFDAGKSGGATATAAEPVPVVLWHKGEQREVASIVKILKDKGIAFDQRDVEGDEPTMEALHREGGGRPLPILFVADTCLGGAVAVRNLASSGELERLISARGGKVESVPDVGALGNPAMAAQVYGTDGCPWTGRVKALLEREDVEFEYIDLDSHTGMAFADKLPVETGHNTEPWVYLRGQFVGGFNALDEIARLGQLAEKTRAPGDERKDPRIKVVVAERENTDETAPAESSERPS
jgi:glutaredoxin